MINSWLIKNFIKHWLNAKRNGHGVHSPFVYELVENVFSNNFDFYAFNDLNKIRKRLKLNKTELEITDFGPVQKNSYQTNVKLKKLPNMVLVVKNNRKFILS